MLKNLVTTTALMSLYRYIKKDWTETDQYKVGLIDANGNKIKHDKLTNDQQEVNTKFSKFSFSLKKILETYPLLKFQFMRSLLNILFVRESHANDRSYVLAIINDELVIIEQTSVTLKNASVANAYSEHGVFVIDESVIIEDAVTVGVGVTNVTSGVEMIQPTLGDIVRRAATSLKRRKIRRERKMITLKSTDFIDGENTGQDLPPSRFPARHD